MSKYRKLTTEEIIKNNKDRYDTYKKYYWDDISHIYAESLRNETKRIEKEVIIPFLAKHGEIREDGLLVYEDDEVRVEGATDAGFIVISMENGYVIHHTCIQGNSYEIKIKGIGHYKEVKDILKQ